MNVIILLILPEEMGICRAEFNPGVRLGEKRLCE